MKLDKNDAPEGFYAVKSEEGCIGCFFKGKKSCPTHFGGKSNRCYFLLRHDGCNVIFKKKKVVNKKPKLKSIVKLKKDADKLWSEYIRNKYNNTCVMCGKNEKTQAHHCFYSKKQGDVTRWAWWNGVCLCYSCHIHKVHQNADIVTIDTLKELIHQDQFEGKEMFKFPEEIKPVTREVINNVIMGLTTLIEMEKGK